MATYSDNEYTSASEKMEKMKRELEEYAKTLMRDLPQRDAPATTNTTTNNTNRERDSAPAQPVPLAAQQPYSDFKPRRFAKPFCKFLSNNPTVFHAAAALAAQCEEAGFTRLSERDEWKLEKGGKYFVERNGSSLIAFGVGDAYEPGNGVGAYHIKWAVGRSHC